MTPTPTPPPSSSSSGDQSPPPQSPVAKAPPLAAAQIITAPSSLLESLESLLRAPRRIVVAITQQPLVLAPRLALATFVALLIFGLLLASFSGGSHYWAVPIKIALGTAISMAICLPSFYIFNCLGGSQLKLGASLALFCALGAMIGLILIALGPVLWLFTQASSSLGFVGCLAVLCWVLATGIAYRFVVDQAAQLGLQSRSILAAWFLIFLAVTFQMATNVRPILGESPTLLPTQKKFFLEHWSDPNHYKDADEWKGAAK